MRRLLILCVVGACAGDGRLDPGDLELRDVLGVAPDTALTWDADQRAAARHVLDSGMHVVGTAHAPPGKVVDGIQAVDTARLAQHRGALGIVRLDGVQLTSRFSSLAPHGGKAIQIELAGWEKWNNLPARGVDLLASIASDAGHRRGPVVVRPAPQLPVIAAYVPSARPQLLVNPVLLAALEPGTSKLAPTVVGIDTIGNPYSFYTSVAACANAQRTRCEACLGTNSCTGDDASCPSLAADDGRGYSLECINLALEIDTVSSCTADKASSCPFDTTPDGLESNANFLDDVNCATALDSCLAHVFGTPNTTTPAPTPTQPTGSSYSCADAACDGMPDCEDTDGCDSSDDTTDSSSCDSGGDSGCSDSGDSCSSGDDCSSGGGDDCGGDSGGDCSGGGGGCSGGGDDCNVTGHHKGSNEHLWALLPLPFAYIARRRADRRRARSKS
ncbi:MAG: hypothetical protein QM831_36535 [Kofleriaceae bacterium]